jgi:RNA polymerase sigma-70 factor (ECF subfamily)
MFVFLHGVAPAETDQSEPDEALRLVERCKAGDRLAFGELYQRYKQDALRFIRHAVRDRHEAEDILQESFLEVASSIGSFAGRSSFQGWLRSICVRTALRHMKRRYRQVGESGASADESEWASREPAPGPDPREGYEQRERARRIGQLLEKLAPKKRMVLLLHDFEGVSPKEISEMVGAPVLTVRTRLFYARKELAALAASDPMLAQDLAPWLSERGKLS